MKKNKHQPEEDRRVRNAKIFLVLALLCFSAGLFLGVLFDTEWLSRFGSLIVIFGVLAEVQLSQIPIPDNGVKVGG